MEISIAFIASAFIAGLLTFLAPCTLPLIPGYISFISGVNTKELEDPETRKTVKKKIFLNGVFFVLGFTLVFVVFGTLAGLAGQALAPYRIWLGRVGGVFVILFGLFMLGVFRLRVFQMEKRMKIPKWLSLGHPSSSFVIGATFAFGWTPCVGPILGSILFLASTSSTALQGGALLAIFSLGLAIPFLCIAFAFSRATYYIQKYARYMKAVSVVGGLFLIFLGFLLMTDNFGLVIQYGYELFDFVNYEGILDHL